MEIEGIKIEPSYYPSLLGLVADIRAAVGDPTGKLMQDELVEHCREMRGQLLHLKVEHSRLIESLTTWRDAPAAEMRLRAGEMTAQEIRSVRAILRCIWPNATGDARADDDTKNL